MRSRTLVFMVLGGSLTILKPAWIGMRLRRQTLRSMTGDSAVNSSKASTPVRRRYGDRNGSIIGATELGKVPLVRGNGQSVDYLIPSPRRREGLMRSALGLGRTGSVPRSSPLLAVVMAGLVRRSSRTYVLARGSLSPRKTSLTRYAPSPDRSSR